MNKIVLIASVLLLCFGCSVGPDYEKPLIYSDKKTAVNLGLQEKKTYKINPQWYKIFNDDDLNRLIELGLANSPNIHTAIENLKQARYKLYIDRAGYLPIFDAKGSYDKSNQNLISPNDYYQVGVDASWELDIWGGQRRLNESAKAMLQAAAADFNNIKITLISEIAMQYINWRLIEKQLQITIENLQLQKDIFSTVEDKYNAGLADDLAYEQAKSVVKMTEMQIPQLKIQEKAYQNALAVLIGKLPSDIAFAGKNPVETKPDFDINQLYNLSVEVIRNRPDVVMAERKLAAENALIGKAVADLFPSISLSSFLGFQNNTLSPIFAPDYNIYSLGTVVNLPLLHWGELVNQVKIQESATKQAFVLYQSSLLTAITDVSNAIKSMEEENKRNKYAFENMKSMISILQLSKQKYDTGLIDFSDISTAEQNKLSAEQNYLQSNAEIYFNIIRFYKAVGGGYSINHNIPACQTDETTSACEPYKD